MTYSQIVSQVASELNLPKTFVDKVYTGYWRMVKKHISSLPLSSKMTKEQFDELKTSVNIPSLGKLYVDKDMYFRRKLYFDKLTD